MTAVLSGSRAAAIQLAKDRTTCDLPTAGRFWGLGVSASYEAHRRGQFPCPVVKIGKRLRVPTSELLTALGIASGEVDER